MKKKIGDLTLLSTLVIIMIAIIKHGFIWLSYLFITRFIYKFIRNLFKRVVIACIHCRFINLFGPEVL